MAQEFPEFEYPAIRFIIGDVRDEPHLKRAMQNIEIVVHSAVLKQVPTTDYNPFECILTNAMGAQNVIEACSILA